MGFVSLLYGSAKFGEEVGVLSAHSVCLLSGVKPAVEEVAVDVVGWPNLVAPVGLLAEAPFPKPIFSRYAIVNATVLGGFALLTSAIRHKLRPLNVVLR